MTEEGLAALQTLAANGELSPERVVQEARSGDSPLHEFFEWDDEKAAHAHRIQQARSLIRSVRVEFVTENIVLQVPKYVHDPDKDEDGGYVETVSLESDRDKARRTIQQEMRRAIGCLRRAQAIAHVVGARDDIGLLIDQVSGFEIP
jgi:hypothetical protein